MCRLVESTGCAAVSVDWRHAPEHRDPAADVGAPLRGAALDRPARRGAWCRRGFRLVLAGRAGAAEQLAAGLALLARDLRRGAALRRQLLVYPMIDDRSLTYSSRAITHERVWNAESNRLAWIAYLGAAAGGVVATYAAPARATDLRGLPTTWLATAALDLFADENIEYAQRLSQAGVSTELHVYPAAMHGLNLPCARRGRLAATQRRSDRRVGADQRELTRRERRSGSTQWLNLRPTKRLVAGGPVLPSLPRCTSVQVRVALHHRTP